MILSGRNVRVFAYARPVDLRKGFDGLCALVRSGLRRDPLSGDLFVFVAKGRRRAKMIYFDGTGLCLLCKRLEKGLFAALWRDAGRATVEMTVSELQLFLEGSLLAGRIALSPAAIDERDLAPQIAV